MRALVLLLALAAACGDNLPDAAPDAGPAPIEVCDIDVPDARQVMVWIRQWHAGAAEPLTAPGRPGRPPAQRLDVRTALRRECGR